MFTFLTYSTTGELFLKSSYKNSIIEGYMIKPEQLKTKIFLDSGDPKETEAIKKLLGFIDGQTTNPTLIFRNPKVQKRIKEKNYFSKEEIYENYKNIVKEISSQIHNGSISVEVYADYNTTADEMLLHGREMFSWIPNAHIKFPTTFEGLKAAEKAVKEGIRVNMTLCFTQEQAACVYSATKGAKRGGVFVSPFIGRLDDNGFNGIELVKNIIDMYGGSHVQVLAASIRNLNHLLAAIFYGIDIITCPFKILRQWTQEGMPLPNKNFRYEASNLKSIPHKYIDLKQPWRNIKFQHKLIDIGLKKFAEDWNKLMR